MDLFFTYFEKPHICARLKNGTLNAANEINKELKLANLAHKNIAFLVKDREPLLREIKVKIEQTLVQIDIRNYFYSIDHSILLEKAREIAPQVVSILKPFLSQLDHSLQAEEFANAKCIKKKCGLVLGHEVFFRLASIYLVGIDNELNKSQKISSYYRFVDDILLVTEYSNDVIFLIESELNKLNLQINYEKLIITPPRQSFTYLKKEFSRFG